MKKRLSVLVAYEGEKGREAAVSFCDALIARFWAQCTFQPDWYSFEALSLPDPSREAAKKARSADVLVFATGPADDVPWAVKGWIESWLSRRGEREGSLVCLSDLPGVTPSAPTAAQSFLRQVAHRAGMDYLTHLPEGTADLCPESVDSCAERANLVTSVLHGILHQPTPPPEVRF